MAEEEIKPNVRRKRPVRLKGGKPESLIKKASAQNTPCDIHPDQSLVFDKITNTLECPKDDCKFRLMPRSEVVKSGRPKIIKGEIPELLMSQTVSQTTEYALRFPESNVTIVIPPHMVKGEVLEPRHQPALIESVSGQVAASPMSPRIEVTLSFSEWVILK